MDKRTEKRIRKYVRKYAAAQLVDINLPISELQKLLVQIEKSVMEELKQKTK